MTSCFLNYGFDEQRIEQSNCVQCYATVKKINSLINNKKKQQYLQSLVLVVGLHVFLVTYLCSKEGGNPRQPSQLKWRGRRVWCDPPAHSQGYSCSGFYPQYWKWTPVDSHSVAGQDYHKCNWAELERKERTQNVLSTKIYLEVCYSVKIRSKKARNE